MYIKYVIVHCASIFCRHCAMPLIASASTASLLSLTWIFHKNRKFETPNSSRDDEEAEHKREKNLAVKGSKLLRTRFHHGLDTMLNMCVRTEASI